MNKNKDGVVILILGAVSLVVYSLIVYFLYSLTRAFGGVIL